MVVLFAIAVFVSLILWGVTSDAWIFPPAPLRPPRFTIRELMLSTALIATGIGGLLAAFRMPEHPSIFLAMFAFIGCPVSGPLIGAGMFLPFGKARLGALYGLLAMLVIACLLPAFQQAR